MEVTLDGERLTAAEVKEILAGASGLALIRGRWVEVDRERLERMMERFREAERLAAEGGLTFAEAMRMLAGADIGADGAADRADPDWSARGRRSLARRDPEGAALARGARGGRSRSRAARHPAALPAGRRPLAPPALAARARRLPRRRHGPRQDHPGALAPPRASATRARRRGDRACWWPRPRCSPTGRRRSSASRRASRP